MDSEMERARALFLDGVRHYQAGRLREAEQAFAAALALAPGRPSVLTNLGIVRLRLGRLQEAVGLLQQALAVEPDNAEALGHCGTALADLGRPAEALAHFDRAVALDPSAPAPWMFRGNVLRELGRPQEAAASFREALARGGDAQLLAYYLAGVEAGDAPAQPPRQYVEALFDGYAAGFDQHLQQALHYDAPQVLVQRIASQGRRFRHALDVGCGTGIAGPLLRPLAERLTGIDLSANMLDQARALDVYDALEHADALEFLAAATGPFDCVLAADVFIYVGALSPVFGALAARMPSGGAFAFTVEESTQGELELRPTLRYAHSEAGIRRLAQEHGFRVAAMERRPVREEQRQPIPGLFFWLEREPATRPS
jgi:predicted TPR repeat methyltransferase